MSKHNNIWVSTAVLCCFVKEVISQSCTTYIFLSVNICDPFYLHTFTLLCFQFYIEVLCLRFSDNLTYDNHYKFPHLIETTRIKGWFYLNLIQLPHIM